MCNFYSLNGPKKIEAVDANCSRTTKLCNILFSLC